MTTETTTRPVRVFIIDDNVALCDAMQSWLSREQGISKVECQTDWRVAEAQVRQSKPDVVILDIDMPGRSGIDLIAPLLSANPDAKIVMFSAMVSPEYVERSLQNGASGYISKDQDARSVAEFVKRAAVGETVFCPAAEAALGAFM